MNFQNTSIKYRLFTGFGAILVFIILFGVAAFLQSNQLWRISSDLYNHPLQVSMATRDIKSDINAIHNLLKDIAFDEKLTPDELNQKVVEINAIESEVFDLFAIVKNKYLGPRADVDSADITFKNWKLLRDRVIELKMKGETEKAYQVYKIENANYREHMFAHIQVMIDYATNKADLFFKNAEKEKQKAEMWIGILLSGMLVIATTIVWAIFISIRRPLLALTRVTDRYRQGNYDARSTYKSTNEIGTLASAFNNMAASVQQEIKLKADSASIAELLMKENELKPFCLELLGSLMGATHSQVAAIYFLNEEKTQFEHFESIGLLGGSFKSFSVSHREGEFGAVLSQKKIVRISDIPTDSQFILPTVSGHFLPREIVTIPIIQNNEVVAVISLASLHNYPDSSIQVLKEIQLMITARIHGVMAFQKISDISEKLNLQNHDLDEKSKELAMQADELKEYNIELKMQKRQVDEANNFKSAFLSNMSHELRTPLNSVIALSGVLNRKLRDKIKEDEYNYLEIIEKNGKQLLLLINDILDLSRIESGKEELHVSKFSIYNLVESIVESVEPLATEKNLRISNTLDRNLPVIASDSSKCHHILQNIISNAVKFTEEGLVEISAIHDKDEFCISIRDTGIGIEPEYLPLVFDEFRQADDKVSRKYGGTGLGLAIAKKYALALGGKISVQSKPGTGSTFTITLPYMSAEMTEISKASDLSANLVKSQVKAYADKASGIGKTILLVEDSEPQIIQMSYILNKEGYSVQLARNGKEALDSIKTEIPDAMILDLMMPEVDGFQVLDSIRSQPETSQIPVLILTAKHVTKNELFFLKGNHIHQIILKGVVNRTELLAHVHNMVNPPEKLVIGTIKKKDRHDGKPVILVIEDNIDNMETVKALLSDKYTVIGSIDSNEGIVKAHEFVPDLILLDISLPGMDGFAVFDELRKDEELRHIPIIALTARAMKGDRETLIDYGFDGYVSKPVDNLLLEQTIHETLEKDSA
jgi:signal transduction histidine kinase/DNA-binding response OmpR family regulator/HAMP domain-containing protein